MEPFAVWWLGIAFVEAEDTEAAAAPAITRDKAKMRTVSFMKDTPLRMILGGDNVSRHLKV